MKKKILSLFLLVFIAFGVTVGCGEKEENGASSSESVTIDYVDYAGELTLDMQSTNTIKLEIAKGQFTHVDGDTTHFPRLSGSHLPEDVQKDGILKARYLGIDTPESTGNIEEWGKSASKFTKNALTSASSIVLETDGDVWDHDANGRYLVWVWYKPEGADNYRNLNVELLQNGLAWGSKASEISYSKACLDAIAQAKKLELHVYSDELDPDYYYGDAIELDLKELRTNIDLYNGKRVAFEANVAYYNNWNVYVEDYDSETNTYYGISAFYGYDAKKHTVLAPGNRVRFVGEVSYYEAGGTYQLTALEYNPREPDNPDTIQLVEKGNHPGNFTETTIETFNSNVDVEKKVIDEETGETNLVTTSVSYSSLIMSTSVSMKNLRVVSTYTTQSGTSEGAITLTCEDDAGNRITVRTAVLTFEDNTVVPASHFAGRVIDVDKGIVDYYDGEYQIKVYLVGDITIH